MAQTIAKTCLGCTHWRPSLERPWLDPKPTDIGSCTEQVERYRHSAFWKTTGASDPCSCGEFTPKDPHPCK